MKFLKFFPALLLVIGVSCNKDDSNNKTDPPRDEGEVYQENHQEIKTFLETHYFSLSSDSENQGFQEVIFDTIAGEHADETPLMEDEHLETKTVSSGKVDYTVYYLKIRKGASEEYQPTFADKVVLTYKTRNMANEVVYKADRPKVVDLPQSDDIVSTRGAVEGITEIKGSSGYTEHADGTISYEDDYGIGAVFVPSGMSYFNSPPLAVGLEAYEPFILSFQLYNAVQMDHDGDGIPSYMEDLNDNGILGDDDTDKDGTPNFLDADDDGDGKPTKEEVIIHKTNKDYLTPDDIEFPDSNDSGTPDYLDPSVY